MRAEREAVEALLKTARGQLDGLLKMVAEDRYCIEISTQLAATQSILRKVNREVLRGHMEHCIAEALAGDDAEKRAEKLRELEALMRRWEKGL